MMKPILILPPEQMSPEDMERLRENDICVVEAKDPSLIRFCDPPPSGNYDQVVEASLNLSRYVINSDSGPNCTFTMRQLSTYWAQLLLNAHPIRKAQVEHTAAVPKNKPKR